jgi:transcriptional regulator with XRE-family HTH domain
MNMTKKSTDEAVRLIAQMEEGVSVTAGSLDTAAFYRRVERQRLASEEKESPFATVLGMFLNLARRDRSLTLDQLALQIEAQPIELLMIEEGRRVPEPRLVSKLARALNVPPGKLMQLAGHIESLDKEVATAAFAFAASASTKPLEPNEKQALHEFVKALASN